MTPDRISQFSIAWIINTGETVVKKATYTISSRYVLNWHHIGYLLSDVAKTTISPSPSLAPHSLDLEMFPRTLQYTITHILLATRLNITRRWKNPNPSTLWEVIDSCVTMAWMAVLSSLIRLIHCINLLPLLSTGVGLIWLNNIHMISICITIVPYFLFPTSEFHAEFFVKCRYCWNFKNYFCLILFLQTLPEQKKFFDRYGIKNQYRR